MIKNNVMGIIFANSNDELLPEFTKKRSIASIPFGGRYRLIDFTLSNLVNAGITKVGVITKSNYNSLLDHLGSGISWDLDRKHGGIFMLPPFSTDKAGFFNSKIDALAGVMTFLKRSYEEYVILCDSDIVSNIDLDKLISFHKASNADITLAYKNGIVPLGDRETDRLNINENGEVEDISKAEPGKKDNYSLDITVISRSLLIDIIKVAAKYNRSTVSKKMLKETIGDIKVLGYEVQDFAEIIYSKESYANISKSLLNSDIREKLFNKERPVFTKTRDDMPTRYGVNSKTENCLIAGGCIIEGNTENSVIFRGVTVGKNATVSNSVIMQGAKIGENCVLKNVILDKASVISDGITLIGKEDNYIYVEKEKII